MSKEFSKKEKYPSPASAFAFTLDPIESIKDEALIILDANVLLLPFTADHNSINAIKDLYASLVKSDQLYLPAQVVREYLDNRAEKISNIYKNLNDNASKGFTLLQSHPLLENTDEYNEVVKIGEQIKDLVKQYQGQMKKLVKKVEDWGWDDPVSQMYHEVLSGRILDDKHIDYEKISEEFNKRCQLGIPPGYKDKSKDTNSSGDLVIWKEIINVAREKNRHVIFVSGDEKPDWWYNSDKKTLYPRFELVDEFREATEIKKSEETSWVRGKSFHIVSLSKLLKIFDADKNVVDSVKSSEQVLQSNIVRSFDSPKKEDCKYRSYLNIPEDHEINISGKGSKVKGGYDTDIYLITELNQDGEVENIYELYDSMKTSPPFNTEIYAKKL